jgi:excinuclease UvrABC nuclease subunit
MRLKEERENYVEKILREVVLEIDGHTYDTIEEKCDAIAEHLRKKIGEAVLVNDFERMERYRATLTRILTVKNILEKKERAEAKSDESDKAESGLRYIFTESFGESEEEDE